jgi:hypothetical protein
MVPGNARMGIMNRRGYCKAFGFATALLLIGAAGARAQSLPPLPVYVVNTKRHVNGLDFDWLDNDRLLIMDGPGPAGHREEVPYRLEIYDIRSGKAVTYKTAEKGMTYQSLCYNGRRVHYQVIAGNKIVQYTGPFRSEKASPMPAEEAEGDPAQVNPLTCRIEKDPAGLPEGARVLILRDGDGRIEIGPGRPVRAVTLRKRDGAAVALPRDIGAMLDNQVQWAPWRGEYLVKSPVAGKDVCKSFYWLKRAGQVQRGCIPVHHVWTVIGSKIGILYQVWNTDADDTPGVNQVLYLYRPGGAPKAVLPGWVGGARVSPDGCKMAFYSPYVSYLRRKKIDANYQIHFIDLCKHEARLKS